MRRLPAIPVGLLAAVLQLAGTLAGTPSPASAQELPPSFHDAVPETQRWHGEPVTMSLRDADLVETLRTFARLGDFNLLIQPGVRGTVTVELKEVPWDQAMSMILRLHGLGMDLTQGTIRIAKPADLARMAKQDAAAGTALRDAIRQRLEVEGRLEHANAVLVARVLERGYLGEKGRAQANPVTNTLHVTDDGDRLRRLARLVARLDTEKAKGADFETLRRRATELWPGTASAVR